MIYTNIHNYPDRIVQKLIESNQQYSKGGADFSATGLAGPTQVNRLLNSGQEPTIDVSRLVARYRGKLLHGILGEPTSDDLIEQRLFMEYNGKQISGEPDWFNIPSGHLYDLKSMLTRQHGFPPKPDHVWQLSVYAELLRRTGYEVKSASLMDWYVDHSPLGTASSVYPQSPIIFVPIELKSSEETLIWISDRIEANKNSQPCTPDEMWSKWAVYRGKFDPEKKQRAAKVEDTKEVAESWAKENLPLKDHEIVSRDGIRCKHYCDVASVCSQWASIQSSLPKHEEK